MDELIRIKGEGYAEYEELLLRRDKLRKEAYIWQGQYMAEFGDMITALFEKKIECIKKKKMISFCQAAANKGETINQNALQAYLEQEMCEYNKQLKHMVAENEAAQNIGQVSTGDLAKIKKLYHKLAKMLHPDINPKTNEVPELQNLWQMIVISYNANDLEDLEEAEILVNKVLSNIGLKCIEVEITNISEKIAKIEDEITKIKTTNPYQYKYLLQNVNAVKEKKESLTNEMKEYEDYEKELERLIEQLMANEVSFVWRMN
jgi:hypothetical protein